MPKMIRNSELLHLHLNQPLLLQNLAISETVSFIICSEQLIKTLALLTFSAIRYYDWYYSARYTLLPIIDIIMQPSITIVTALMCMYEQVPLPLIMIKSMAATIHMSATETEMEFSADILISIVNLGILAYFGSQLLNNNAEYIYMIATGTMLTVANLILNDIHDTYDRIVATNDFERFNIYSHTNNLEVESVETVGTLQRSDAE